MTRMTMLKWRRGERRDGPARPDKTTRRWIERRPGIEVLENRACPSLTLSLSVLTGTVGTAFSQQVQVTGGDSSDKYEFSATVPEPGTGTGGIDLPPGLSISEQGLLSGTPTQPGSYPITIAVTDKTTKQSAQAAFPLVISPLITVTGNIPSGTENASYSSGVITASGEAGQSFTFAISGNVPPGLDMTTLSGTTAQLTGTPTAWGTYSFTVSATDTSGYEGTQTFQVTISPVVTFSPPPATASLTLDGGPSSQADTVLPSGIAGQPYSPQTISVASDSDITALTTSLGSTPSWNGLSVTTTSNTVTISGTPLNFTNPTLGAPALDPLELTVTATVTATDGTTYSDATTYQINIEPATSSSPYVAVQASFGGTTHDDLPTVIAGQPFTATFVTPPGTGTFQFSLMNASSLPPGMSFDANSGVLSGNPSTPGLYNLVVQATNATSGVIDSRVFLLTVNPDPSGLQITPVTLPLAVYGTPYNQQITISGPTSVTWSWNLKNSLADLGLSIVQNGNSSLTISGTPTVATTWETPVLTITATDSSGTQLTQSYSFTTDYTPQQIRQAYGLDQVTLSGGIIGDGTGQTVVIIDSGDAPNLVSSNDPNYANSDLHLFNQQFGLPDSPFQKLDAFGGTNIPIGSNDDPGETTQDVEWVHAIAPGASIVLLEYASGDLYSAIQTAKRLPGVSVVSISLEFFDDDNSTDVETNLDPLFTSPAGHPMTFIAAAGDGDNGPLAIYPAVSTNVVAVGYTQLTLNAQGGYQSEMTVSGAGGGPSVQELQPSWQQGVVGQSSSTMRVAPDVTFNGGTETAVATYNSYTHGTGLPFGQGNGTSIATPCWAGLMAIVNQGRALTRQLPLDGPTQTLPDLYALVSTADFNQILTIGPPSGGVTPTSISPLFGGYNPWAGLGSPVANHLAADLIGGKNTISGTVFLNADGSGAARRREHGSPGPDGVTGRQRQRQAGSWRGDHDDRARRDLRVPGRTGELHGRCNYPSGLESAIVWFHIGRADSWLARRSHHQRRAQPASPVATCPVATCPAASCPVATSGTVNRRHPDADCGQEWAAPRGGAGLLRHIAQSRDCP